MRWKPGPDEKNCPGNEGGTHVVPEFDVNVSHCHPRRKGECVACGQMTYAIALNKKDFSEFYTMPAAVWSSRGVKEALRTKPQWVNQRYKARVS